LKSGDHGRIAKLTEAERSLAPDPHIFVTPETIAEERQGASVSQLAKRRNRALSDPRIVITKRLDQNMVRSWSLQQR